MQTVETIPPSKTPGKLPWSAKPNQILDIEFRGFKFKVVYDHLCGVLVFGDDENPPVKQTVSYYGEYWKGDVAHAANLSCAGDQSCAYLRYRPIFVQWKREEGILTPNAKHCNKPWVPAAYAWVLSHMQFTKATTCYVTYLDGQPTMLVPTLKARGFRHVATNKSNHGNYDVYLLIHPGDNNIDKEPKDAVEHKTS